MWKYINTHTSPSQGILSRRKYLNSLLWSTSSSPWLPCPYHGHRSLFHSAVSVPSGICVNTILPHDLGTGCSLCLESYSLRFVHVPLPNIIQVFAQMLPNREAFHNHPIHTLLLIHHFHSSHSFTLLYFTSSTLYINLCNLPIFCPLPLKWKPYVSRDTFSYSN